MRKKIVSSILTVICLSLIVTTTIDSKSVNALAITKAGITEYNGIINDQAFAWTGADAVVYVYAIIELGNKTFVGFKDSQTGWVQTPQVSYKSSDARGNHYAESSTDSVTLLTYPK